MLPILWNHNRVLPFQLPAHAPRFDVLETDEAFDLLLDLPGVPREQLRLSCESDVLTVSGERLAANGPVRRERWQGAFRRSFRLPQGTDTSRIEAHLADGVLRIRLPKGESARTRRIEIK